MNKIPMPAVYFRANQNTTVIKAFPSGKCHLNKKFNLPGQLSEKKKIRFIKSGLTDFNYPAP